MPTSSRIVGDVVGKPATDALIAEIADKLENSGRFDGVEVRKRFRSIENPDDILLMVDRRRSARHRSTLDLTPRPDEEVLEQRHVPADPAFDDGYGFTYGARISFVDRLGPRSRITCR